MNIHCDKDAVYGIEGNDGLGTVACEEHLQVAMKTAWYDSHYKLEELE